MINKMWKTKIALALSLTLSLAVMAVTAQDIRPDVKLATGKVQGTIQLPSGNPNATCSNLRVQIVKADGSGQVQATFTPTQSGGNACSYNKTLLVSQQQLRVDVKPAGVSCPLGQELAFGLNWSSSPLFKLTQDGQVITKNTSVTSFGCAEKVG